MAVGPYWHAILPAEKTNLVDGDSSFERGTIGAGTIESSVLGSASNKQAFGAWSLSVAPSSNGTSGAYVGTGVTADNTAYSYSAFVRGVNGVSYLIAATDTSNAILSSMAFTGGGTWQRYVGSYTTAGGAVTRIVVRKASGANTGTYYVDAVQLEAGSVTTFIHGDQEGCSWLAAPYRGRAARSGQSRAGGSIVSLASMGVIVEEESGIGMPPIENTSLSYALADGAEYQRSRAAPRAFTLTSLMVGTTWEGLHTMRQGLIDLLKIDRVTPRQPVRLLYTGGPGTVQIDTIYDAGLEFGERRGFSETPPVRLIAYDPMFYSPTEQGTSLASYTTISVQGVVCRDPLGRWGTMNGGVNNTVLAGVAANGSIFFGGWFTTAGGTTAQKVAFWSESTKQWGTLAGGTLIGNLGVFALAYSPSGTLFAGGDFNTAMGSTNSRGLAMWTGAGWGTLGGTVGGSGSFVFALHYNAGGTLFAGGSFLTANGTRAVGIAQWAGAFGSLTGGGTLYNGAAAANVFAITQTPAGLVYLTGEFGTAAGSIANSIASWNGTFGTLSYGFNSAGGGGPDGNSLSLGPNGILYVGCSAVIQAGSVTVTNIAAWNGVQFSALGSGLGTSSEIVYNVQALPDGRVLAGGIFGRSGSFTFPDSMAQWNGYTWLPLDIDILAEANIHHILQAPSGTLYIGLTLGVNDANIASVTQVVNAGRTDTYPTLRVKHTGNAGTIRLFQIANTLTNDYLYFNYQMLPGEEARFDFTPNQRSFTSDFQGTIINKIIPGSNVATFRLQPGTNYISFFADGTALQTDLHWQPRSWSADGGTIYS